VNTAFHRDTSWCKECARKAKMTRYWRGIADQLGQEEAARRQKTKSAKERAARLGLRVCARCFSAKKKSDFYGGHNCYCKKCHIEYQKDYLNNPQRKVRRRKQQRNNNLRRKYGIDQAEYERLLRDQRSRCAICNKRPKSRKLLAVDHDHMTGRVRGLLCTTCNNALGMLGDGLDSPIFQKAEEYLGRVRG